MGPTVTAKMPGAPWPCARTGAGMTGKERILAKLRGEPTDSPAADADHHDVRRRPPAPITATTRGTTAYWPTRRSRVAEAFGFDYVSAISDPAREAARPRRRDRVVRRPAARDRREPRAARRQGRSRLCAYPTLGAPPHARSRRGGASARANAPAATRIVEGWVEGPCAMSADLRGVNTLMLDFFDDPGFVRDSSPSPSDGSGIRARPDRRRSDLIGVGMRPHR